MERGKSVSGTPCMRKGFRLPRNNFCYHYSLPLADQALATSDPRPVIMNVNALKFKSTFKIMFKNLAAFFYV